MGHCSTYNDKTTERIVANEGVCPISGQALFLNTAARSIREEGFKMRRIQIKRELCDGCMKCTTACAAEHNTADSQAAEETEPESRINILPDVSGHFTPFFCRQCDQPQCVLACISGAMAKNPLSGRVTYDADRCAACFMCVLACPFGVPKPDQSTQSAVIKCDLCNRRDTPRCIESCPKGALVLMEVDA